MANWMNYIPKTIKLSEICMPGSHDAGMIAGQEYFPGNKYACQDLTIYQQCYQGVRFFDLRIGKNNNNAAAYHGFPPFREYGVRCSTFLNDVAQFLTEQPSEFVVVRIDHTKAGTEEMLNLVQHHQAHIKLPANGGFDIGRYRRRDVMGHMILLCKEGDHFTEHRPAARPFCHEYRKGNVIDVNGQLTTILGDYSDENRRMQILNKQIPQWDAFRLLKGDNPSLLYCLYLTNTGQILSRLNMNIRQLTESQDHGMKPWIIQGNNLQGRFRVAMVIPNIIFHDFCDEQTCERIVALNRWVLRLNNI